MKVCTDSCLFGAWVGDYLYKNALDPSYILDAGSGTGLLSLMLAQKTSSQISKKLFPSKIAIIQHSPIHESFRVFILFEKKELELVYENICIRNEVNEYTSVFQYLLCDYYL